MSSGLFVNLNTALSFSFQRGLRVKRIQPLHLIDAVSGVHSRADLSSPFSEVLRLPSYLCNRRIMAASGSKAASGDLAVEGLLTSSGNSSSFVTPTHVYFGHRNVRNCRKVSLRMRIGEATRVCGSQECSTYGVMQKSWYSNPGIEVWSRNCQTFTSSCYSDGAVPNVSTEQSSEPLVSLATEPKDYLRKTPAGRVVKLDSGSCYMPHPAKEETGGEDSHFISTDKQAIGVADGVGGWADVGINAGEYSRELMSNSVNAILSEPDGDVDPLRVLEKAHAATKAKGSSTACIIVLAEEGLHAINLGDSGFIVVRDGKAIFESPVQQHGFNFTYQLESSSRSDLPSSGQVFRIPVAPGDVIVAGTDGLFDNLYHEEIADTVAQSLREGLTPEATAQKIAGFARQCAQDRTRQTPFSTSAQEAGFVYYGGKLDDITVVVSFISAS